MSSNSRVSRHVKRNKQFWQMVEVGMRLRVPDHLQLVLENQFLDNPVTMKSLEVKDIPELEEFARSEKYHRAVEHLREPARKKSIFCGGGGGKKKSEDPRKPFGIFHKDPENFKFNVGEKFMILAVAKYVAENEQLFH